MKVVIVKGSYKKNGVTAALVDSVVNGLKSTGLSVNIKIIDLLDIPIEFCSGCISCTAKDEKALGTCIRNDSMKDILNDLLEADRIVFASPIYEGATTALMKRFMERCMPILYMTEKGPIPRNQISKNKKALVMVSSSTPYPINIIRGVTKYPANILSHFCKGFGCNSVKTIKAGGMDSLEHLRKKFMDMAYKYGVELAN